MIQRALLLLCMLCVLGGEAKAQLFLEEGKVSLAVSPGERIDKSLVLHNTSAQNADVKVYWEDFQYTAPYEGTKDFLPAGTAAASASTWVTYAPREFTIPPFGIQKIDYSIAVPQDDKGGHYGVLFFEKSSAPAQNEKGLTIITRVGCLFFLEAKDRAKTAVLEDLNSTSSAVTGHFNNKSDAILIPRITYYFMQEGELVVDRGELKKLYVPPGASASWSIPLSKDLSAGHYTLVVNADLDEGDVVVQEVGFIKDASGKLTIDGVRD